MLLLIPMRLSGPAIRSDRPQRQMSKLDRQLDDFSSGGRVEIHLPAGEEVDVGGLHQMLRNEIDSRPHRIPLDLRGVHGAPKPLIDVLIESQRYARSQGKLLSISYALPPMKEALNPRRRRKAGKYDDAIDDDEAADAGSVAKTLLDTRLSEENKYDISKAERIRRDKKTKKKTKKKKQNKLRDYLVIGALILLCGTVVGIVEWMIVFHDPPDTIVPNKTFE